MAKYRLMRTKLFRQDVDTEVGGDPVQRERVERRIAKLSDHPTHHGDHLGALLRCRWSAGVGDWAIVYEIDERQNLVTLLRFVELPE